MQYAEFAEKFNIQLNPQQAQAVQACQGPVLLLAVPGSGKTTVLITRLGYLIYGLGVPSEQILTVTYTVAAARDMEDRFFQRFGGESTGSVHFSTIHSFCAGVIRYYERVRQTRAFPLISREMDQSRILRQLIQQQTGEYPGDAAVREAATQITYCKNKMLKREEIEAVHLDDVDFPRLFFAYESWKRQNHRMDFDDQLEYARRILLKNPDILAYYRRRYRYIQVDEAQDTSKIQHVILRMLLGKEQNLFMVGDEDQSIYGFRAAYPEALLEFSQQYRGAQVLSMEKNYRSLPSIVEKANGFIQQNRKRYEKHMTAERPAQPGIPVQIVSFPDSSQQYGWLLEQAQNSVEETAVLYRNHDSALPLIDLLEKKQISYQMRESNTLFFTHFLVQDIQAMLLFARNPEDARLFSKIYYKLGCAIRKEEMEKAVQNRNGGSLLEALKNLPSMEKWKADKIGSLIGVFHRLKKLSTPAALSCILEDLSYREYFYQRSGDDSRLRILRALADQNREQDKFLQRLEQLRQIVTEGRQHSPFILSTIHASKGLEFDRVILIDVRDGILPTVEEPVGGNQLSLEERELLEEERRLFYVAVTRAKNKLEILQCRREYGSPVRGFSFIRKMMEEKEPEKRKWSRKKPEIGQDKRIGQAEAYQPGCLVWHTGFGDGSILERKGDRLTVLFVGKQEKRQLLLSACLKSRLLYLRQK